MALDKVLWYKIAGDDQDTFAEVYRYLFGRFYNYGCKFTSDFSLIEDAVQETLMLIWEKRKSLTSIRYPETYFYSAFRNGMLTKLRLTHTVSSASEVGEPEFSIEQIIINRETDFQLNDKLKKAIRGLTTRQREAIFLRFYEGLSYEDVATVLSISTKASYKIVSRALHQLREIMTLCTFFILLFY